jgi:hypothetical protein
MLRAHHGFSHASEISARYEIQITKIIQPERCTSAALTANASPQDPLGVAAQERHAIADAQRQLVEERVEALPPRALEEEVI